jgi:HAMP domain-containing protein
MTALLAIFAVMLLLLNILLHVFIVLPVRRISRLAEAVSLGNMDLPEFDDTSHDEIGALAQSFARMRRSLVAAMGLLET